MELQEKLKNRRLELGLTLEEVANAVGVSKATVQRWESGNIANMRRDRIGLLSKILRVSPLFVMGWEEEAVPGDSVKAVPEPLRHDETSLLTDYRKLNPNGKGKVREYANDLAEQPKYTNRFDKLNGLEIG